MVRTSFAVRFYDGFNSDLSPGIQRTTRTSEEARDRITPSFESSTLDSAAARRAGEFPHNQGETCQVVWKNVVCALCHWPHLLWRAAHLIRRRVSKQMAKILCLGFVTTNGAGYPPRVIEAAGILDHLYASMKTNHRDNLQRKTGILFLVWSLLVFHSLRCVYNKRLGTLPSISEVLERLGFAFRHPMRSYALKILTGRR